MGGLLERSGSATTGNRSPPGSVSRTNNLSQEMRRKMSHPATIDQKGRLKIPVDLLAALRKSGTEFYVTSESGDSVRIYPMPVWNRFEERLARLCLRKRSYQK